jgi:hypothetical protein
MRNCLRLLSLLALFLLPLGCGKHYNLAPVSGRVTLDGHPLAHAEVRFIPLGHDDVPPSIGTTDDDGQYEVHLAVEGNPAGALIGENRITISQDQRHGKVMPAAGMHKMQRPGELLPSKYNRDSQLTVTVPPEGKSDANFDLKSR